jgi:hypothetical protein
MKRKVLLAIFGVLAVVGCTREVPKTSSLSVGLGSADNSSLSAPTGPLMRLMINVSGPGISNPIVFVWENPCRESQDADLFSAACAPPPSFSFQVPSGDSRLIQVLGVYIDMSTQGMAFYYGDVAKKVSGATDSAEVTISNANGLSVAIDGQISGRYLVGDNVGPTGELEIRYTPPGRPSMIVDRDFMFSGWFSVFGLAGIEMDYVVRPISGAPAFSLFGGPTSLNSSRFTVPGATALGENVRVGRAALPVRWRQEDGSDYRFEAASYYVWGYFGTPLAMASASWSQRQVCISTTGDGLPLSRFKKHTPNLAAITAQPALAYSTSNSTVSVSETDLTNVSGSALGVVYVGGGTASPSCPTAGGLVVSTDKYTKYLEVNKSMLDGNGKDGAAGFRNGLRSTGNGSVLNVTPIGGGFTIAGQVLPGVNSVVNGFRFFKRIGPGGSPESPKCSEVVSGQLPGFVPAGEAGLDATGGFSLSANIVDAEVTAGISGVLCPLAGGQVFGRGLFMRKDNFKPQQSQYQLTISPGATGGSYGNSPNTQGVNDCKEYRAELRDNSGALVPATTNIGLQFQVPPSGILQLYSNPGCSSGQVNSASISSGQSSASIYAKITATGVYELSASGNNVQNVSIDLHAPSGTLDRVRSSHSVSPVPTMVIGQCYPIKVSLQDTSSFPAVDSSPVVIDTFTGPGNFFTDQNCSNALNAGNPLSIPAYTAAATIYFIPNTTGTAHTIYSVHPTLPDTASSPFWVDDLTNQHYGVMVSSMDSGTHYDATEQVHWLPSGCNPIYIEPRSVNRGIIRSDLATAGSLTLSVNTSGTAHFYTNSSCTGAGAETATYDFNPNGNSSTVWFKPNGATSFVMQSTLLPTGTTSNFPVRVKPAQVLLQSTGPSVCNGTDANCSVLFLASFRTDIGTPYQNPGNPKNINFKVNGEANYKMRNSVGDCSAGVFHPMLSSSVASSDTGAWMAVCSDGAPSGVANLTAEFMGKVSNVVGVGYVSGGPGAYSAPKLLSSAGISPANIKTNACEKVMVVAVDSVGHWMTSQTSSISGNFDTNTYSSFGGLSMSQTCGTILLGVSVTSPGTLSSFASGMASYYYKATAGFTKTLTLTSGGAASITFTSAP